MLALLGRRLADCPWNHDGEREHGWNGSSKISLIHAHRDLGARGDAGVATENSGCLPEGSGAVAVSFREQVGREDAT